MLLAKLRIQAPVRPTWILHRLLLIALLILPCAALIYEDISELPTDSFDFIVVGGGTAGNVIANRLTENDTFSVLVLEAGPSHIGVLNSSIPFFASSLAPNTAWDWNYTTALQPGLNNRSVPYIRGHMLGGSSAVNYMVYSRGTRDDWDRYSNFTGDNMLGWDNVQEYFAKNERWVDPVDGHDTTGEFDATVHSTTGVNFVSLAAHNFSDNNRVVHATQQMDEEFPFVLDYNSGNNLGVGWTQATIGHGVRSSSAFSYLGDEFINRTNLHVLVNAHVTRLVQTNSTDNLTFQSVELGTGAGGTNLSTFSASKEIVLSAGAFGSPHILLHSGIGDNDTLSSLGISTLLHNPSVGQNLTDHPIVANSWLVNSSSTFEQWTHNLTHEIGLIKLWNRTHSGPLADPYMSHLGWLRLNDTVLGGIFGQEITDPAAGPETAHIEFVIQNGIIPSPVAPTTGNYITISTGVLTPLSVGSVTINSSDPFAPPVIDPAIFSDSDQFDFTAMKEAIQKASRFLTAPAWDHYILSPVGTLANATTNEGLEAHIRANARVFYHPVSTAKMTPEDAGFGVVNPDFKVKGVSGLRVVDSSVIPFVPSAHTQAAVYAFAERAADLIKQEWATAN